jgi:hypothetical protein
MRLFLCLLCLLISAQVHAQSPERRDAPLQEPPPLGLEMGKTVRVKHGTEFLEGRLLETNPESLTLDAWQPSTARERVPLSGVLELSVRRRSVARGTLIGAGAGFLTGIPYGYLLCGTIDYSTTGGCLLTGGLVGVLFALPGAALGAIIGVLIPRWESVYERTQDGPLVLPSLRAPEELWQEDTEGAPRGTIVQLSLLASGVVTLAEPDDAFGSGLRIEALAQIGPHIAVGPELAFHYLHVSLRDARPPNEPLASFGVLMRATPRPSTLTPSLLIGFSLHSTGQPATYCVGGALDVGGPDILPLTLELRWHQFNVPWKDGRQLTLGIGTRLFW